MLIALPPTLGAGTTVSDMAEVCDRSVSSFNNGASTKTRKLWTKEDRKLIEGIKTIKWKKDFERTGYDSYSIDVSRTPCTSCFFGSDSDDVDVEKFPMSISPSKRRRNQEHQNTNRKRKRSQKQNSCITPTQTATRTSKKTQNQTIKKSKNQTIKKTQNQTEPASLRNAPENQKSSLTNAPENQKSSLTNAPENQKSSPTNAPENQKSSPTNAPENQTPIVTYKTHAGTYRQFCPKVNAAISSCLDQNLQAFWVCDDAADTFFMLDLESMQRHDISTGRSRPIRLENQANCGVDQSSKCLCGEQAGRKLTLVRLLQIQRSPLITEMRQLPAAKQFFDPAPMRIKDPRFPFDQIKHLRHGGLTVHAVRPTTAWKRNRRCFDALLAEEQKMFATPEGVPQLKHFAWYGAPADFIKGILEFGFLPGHCMRAQPGVCLSTESHARYSMQDHFSKPDAAGFKYILLCEVLPGSVEVSQQGQVRPQTEHTHSGVDKLPGASMHVFYSYDMNVRVSPKFVVCIHPKVTADLMQRVPNCAPTSTT